jgi:hypothetical protein
MTSKSAAQQDRRINANGRAEERIVVNWKWKWMKAEGGKEERRGAGIWLGEDESAVSSLISNRPQLPILRSSTTQQIRRQ